MQSRKHSMIESVANIAIGYTVAVATQAAVFPLFDINASTTDHLGIAAVFTAVSLVRSYALRRIFTRATERQQGG